MATLSELVDTLAEVEGMDRASLYLIARYIREEGLITTGGRGPSAATMSVSDAANLLIAANASESAASAAKTTRVYRALEAYEPRSPGDPRPPLKYGTLAQGVEGLIKAMVSKEFPEMFLNQVLPYELHDGLERGLLTVELTFARPVPSATIRLGHLLEELEVSSTMARYFDDMRWGAQLFYRFELAKGRVTAKSRIGQPKDRREVTTIGDRTLNAVGELLRR